MKTFKGVPVPPIDEILERTIYVKKKNTEIERLTEENEQLRRQLEVYVDANAALHATLSAQHALLVEAQAELHDLRIRAGIGERVEPVQYGDPVGSFTLEQVDGRPALVHVEPGFRHVFYLPENVRLFLVKK